MFKLKIYQLILPLAGILMLTINPLGAKTAKSILSIARANSTITFDGLPEGPCWENATPIPVFQHSPNFGDEPTEQTEMRIAYNDKYLWVFAKLYYNDPSNIVSKTKKRDGTATGTDIFGIILDTYNTNESALAFFTSPSGHRTDYEISNDASGSSFSGKGSINYSWNTFWDVKTARTPYGWSMEMRVPFSSLKFQEVGGKVTMGLMVNRKVSHNNELYTYPEIDPKHGMLAPIKPSLAAKIEFEGIKAEKPVYVSPYVITGMEQKRTLSLDKTHYDKDNSPELDAGLDIKYNISSNLTLDLTANTDFAQVEADDERVNITRYSLYFPEKRMFFQERSSLFGFGLGGSQELFYSRRIGISHDGPVRIFGGARLTGRVGKWDIGLLDMQTQKLNDIPSENFGVFRVRRQVVNENSFLGAMATTRLGNNGSRSAAYGIDGIFRLFGDDYLETKVAQVANSETENPGFKDNSFAHIQWERRNQKGFSYKFSYGYTGKMFYPTVGFISKLGVQSYSARAQYDWLPGNSSKIYSLKLFLSNTYVQRIQGKELESRTIFGGVSVSSKTGWTGFGSFSQVKDGIKYNFYLAADAYVPAGEYSYLTFFSLLSSPSSKPLSVSLNLSGGGYYDGNRLSASFSPMFRASSSLQLSGSYSLNKISFDKRNQKFTSHIARLKLMYMHSTKVSLSSFIQYNSQSNLAIGNIRLRYNPREGNDFYLVYNEIKPSFNYDFGEARKVPFLNRMVLLKYIHTFKM